MSLPLGDEDGALSQEKHCCMLGLENRSARSPSRGAEEHAVEGQQQEADFTEAGGQSTSH